ncbi:MAG: hypothetical protein COA82_03645 [Alkaliphilus sp.]|nr:MAG: hypothetical protein COA82_03645 [Alkaliphilus sp.]
MAVEQVTVDEWAIALVSSIWGAWTSKSSNILNYYFGDSAQVEANNVTINTALENASTTTSNGMSKRQIINHSLLDVDNLDGGGDDTEINRE